MSSLSPPQQWFIFQGDRLLFIKNDDISSLPNEITLPPDLALYGQYPLGALEDKNCFCAEIDNSAQLPDYVIAVPLRKAFELIGSGGYSMATKAFSVVNWNRNHQFCGHCGNKTIHKMGRFERLCERCGLAFYPRISPSMIVLIQRDDHVLMARSPHFVPGAYGLIAGFIEVGESIEEAVHREIKEEVGVTVKNLRYFGSQPWPFPDSLMIGFIADYADGEIQIDHHEIEAAGWYKFDNLPGRPSTRISIASQLIDHFVAEQHQKSLK